MGWVRQGRATVLLCFVKFYRNQTEISFEKGKTDLVSIIIGIVLQCVYTDTEKHAYLKQVEGKK